MPTRRAKATNPLKPEVLAVIRSSFDGYNEPDSKGGIKKQAAKKVAEMKGVPARTKARL
jgi:hypothetical protein